MRSKRRRAGIRLKRWVVLITDFDQMIFVAVSLQNLQTVEQTMREGPDARHSKMAWRISGIRSADSIEKLWFLCCNAG